MSAAMLQADGLNAAARVGVPADHRGIICDRHVFRILKHWLKAGEPDPFYNPLNDYVILPTAFEIERHTEKSLQVLHTMETADELQTSGVRSSVAATHTDPSEQGNECDRLL
ncbi:hypothetical protein BHE74_00013213 [Ensete ventricosum]|nr:hypothetical protein BHE74_00013213 [Ensete ventricosum]